MYFLDGGLADNLAIHGLLETISSPYAAPIIAGQDSGLNQSSTILDAVNTGKIKKLAVIVVNARADPANTISQTPSRPGIVGMIESVTSVPIDSTTASVSSQMGVLLAQLNAAGGGGAGTPQFAGLKVYAVQVDFDQLRASDPVQRELRDKANAIPTALDDHQGQPRSHRAGRDDSSSSASVLSAAPHGHGHQGGVRRSGVREDGVSPGRRLTE